MRRTRWAALAAAMTVAAMPALADGGGSRVENGITTPGVPAAMREVAPALASYTDAVLFGDLWKRPDLSPRDRSIATLAALIATGQSAALPPYLDRALDDGVKPAEVSEIITHLAFYTGWPNAVSAVEAAKPVFARRGIDPGGLAGAGEARLPVDPDAEARRVAYVEQSMGGVAPALRDYTNGVLFDELWRRPGLSPRDRSLVTISALIAGNKGQQLVGHLNRALDNGLTKAEVGAVITQLAFYAGWPNAASAVTVAKAVFDKRP